MRLGVIGIKVIWRWDLKVINIESGEGWEEVKWVVGWFLSNLIVV